MQKRCIIVHGYKSKPDTNWKPWLKRELEQAGFEVLIPEMPDTNHPYADAWVNKLAETVGEPDEHTYLVGHSLGCITILRYLEGLQEAQAIGGGVLVAGFGGRFKKYAGGHDSFFNHELNWDEITQHSRGFTIIHSEDDSSVEIEQAFLLQKALGARLVAVNGMGHFGSPDGVYEVPVVKDEIILLSTR